tara:strand:- start:78 stop:1496 length:1419 start_codon:yes stop_codon:yes gene_type:complete
MKMIFILFILNISFTQEIFTEYLTEGQDTIDVFSYQIPEFYDENDPHPLIVTFHQWGGNENSNYYTQFDEEANNRNWIFLSPYGGSSNNYNHQGMQAMVESEIIWMMENFNIDKNKIYMVGGSMGGASGAIYANNHLDPTKPMVAATASASGILDCERRAIEMDGNNSMIEWFGGEWYEVPFEYHRNSAVYFADSTQSMHYNLKHTPLYLDFGVTEPHREHAEDLYGLLDEYNENMWIDTEPTGSHGYSVFDENHVCDWLDQFDLIDNPEIINVNLDEPSRAYWIEVRGQFNNVEFIRANVSKNTNNIFDVYNIYEFTNSDSIILHNTIDISNTELEIQNSFINNNYFIGLSGNDISSINEINATGIIFNENIGSIDETEILDINIQNQIVWISIPNLEFINILIDISYFPADINQDGIWNVLDVVLVINYIFGLNTLSDEQIINADLNQDGIINVLDIVEMVNIILTNQSE